MRKQSRRLGVTLAVLIAGSVGFIATGTHLYAQYRIAYADYQLAPTGPCGALIAWSPPTTIYTAFYASQPNLVTIRYRSFAPQTLHISVSIPHFTQVQSVQLQAAPAFQERVFKPPLLDSSVLDSLVSADQRVAQIHLRVQSDTGTTCDATTPVTLWSRQWMHWYDPTTGDNAKYLAGWVTPHASVIGSLIGRTAQWLARNPSNYPGTTSLDGYDEGLATAQDVRNQVDAIFDTLQFVYHVHYAQDNVPYSLDASQRIQLPKDVLSSQTPTAMCVETTAIMASAVESLGMRPYFIIVPGHAFLGVALGPGPSAPIDYWETSDLNGGITGTQANVHGASEYNMYRSQGKILLVVDVALERQQGIQPIE